MDTWILLKYLLPQMSLAYRMILDYYTDGPIRQEEQVFRLNTASFHTVCFLKVSYFISLPNIVGDVDLGCKWNGFSN